jgi:hypothetical protein
MSRVIHRRKSRFQPASRALLTFFSNVIMSPSL